MGWYTCLLLVFLAAFSSHTVRGSRQLLLVSFDGFRYDYVNKARMPFFREMMDAGTWVQKVKGAFPTLTFPNHWTIVTGRYPENHEIVSNSMYDPASKERFSMSTVDAKWWNTSEPIWVTGMKQGLTAATYFWPGSEVELQGFRPMHWYKYSDSTPNLVRVNEVIRWLKDEKINIVTLYFNQPDSIGHSKGPNAPESLQMVEEMDSVLGYLTHQLRTAGLEDSVNVIVSSDHGMAVGSPTQVIRLPQYTNWSNVEWSYMSAVGFIYPKPGYLNQIYEDLKDAHPQMKVYYKEEIPARLHFNKSSRITPIVILADEGWVLTSLASGGSFLAGVHGYDNDLASMNSMLVAKGPDFRKGYVKETIDSVDLYPLMCRLLGMRPEINDGNLTNVLDVIAEKSLASRLNVSDCFVILALLQALASVFW